uniref:Uncharacterized protein n=1 Tax=Tetradesmus obliquus TaxID=3088 RepID=A0A383W3P4_TETOB|eukprot:jgi/Sobl393_1/10585/SZX72288.1
MMPGPSSSSLQDNHSNSSNDAAPDLAAVYLQQRSRWLQQLLQLQALRRANRAAVDCNVAMPATGKQHAVYGPQPQPNQDMLLARESAAVQVLMRVGEVALDIATSRLVSGENDTLANSALAAAEAAVAAVKARVAAAAAASE